MIMAKAIRVFKYTFAFIFFVLFTNTGCVSVKKNKVNFKSKESFCSLAQLVGPDRYYYSASYQRKLKKSIKRIGRQ